MEVCKISIYLAYFGAIYIGTTIYYLLRTKLFDDIGTPFYDSLTDAQKNIKKQSSNTRKNVFYQGLVISTLFLLGSKPFKVCN